AGVFAPGLLALAAGVFALGLLTLAAGPLPPCPWAGGPPGFLLPPPAGRGLPPPLPFRPCGGRSSVPPRRLAPAGGARADGFGLALQAGPRGVGPLHVLGGLALLRQVALQRVLGGIAQRSVFFAGEAAEPLQLALRRDDQLRRVDRSRGSDGLPGRL